jgi:scyllo-inositol 2-dehydrogenase (NADP+)
MQKTSKDVFQSSAGPIRVGIAGLGRSGWGINALTLAEMPDLYRIAAVMDTEAGRRREAEERFHCRSYANFKGLVEDNGVELIVIATPNYLHAGQTIDALAAGRHVVCDKPMAGTCAEADRMIAAAEKAGRILTILQNRRYFSDFLKVREVIRSGKLGEIIQIRMADHLFTRRWDWQTLKEFGGGMLNNLVSHNLDLALDLFGEAEPQVFCRMKRTPLTAGDAEDHCKIILSAPGAPTIDLEVTNACAYPQDNWHVMGAAGGLRGTRAELQWKYVRLEELPERRVERTPTPDRTYNSETLPWREETWQLPENQPSFNAVFYRDLYLTLRRNAPVVITPQSVRRQLAVKEKCRKLCEI